MDEALWHKFTQHGDLKRELLATGDAELIEVCLKTKWIYVAEWFLGIGPRRFLGLGC